MIRHAKQLNKSIFAPRGFTLVEMLVSVALVLLMMTMFAAVFQIATDSISNQQANSENDQKARALQTVFDADFAKRTNRNVQPFTLGETSATSPTAFGDRQGYIYISTNNPDSYSDDFIQFTVNIDQISENVDETDIFGQAISLVDPVSGFPVLSDMPNQPERDDSQLTGDATASSSVAEICYFIRNGNLYRRQILVRKPLPGAGGDLVSQPNSFRRSAPNSPVRDFFAGYTDDSSDVQKAATFSGNFRLPGATVYVPASSTFSTGDDVWTNDFYRFFDFSAYPNFRILDAAGPSPLIFTAQFIGVESLSNDATVGGSGPVISLGKPRYRFGFDWSDGLSREHLTNVSGVAEGFMGRFLHAETSAPNFNYPQQPCNVEGAPGTVLKGGNPMDIDAATFSLNQYGVITDFDNSLTNGRGGVRAQEDLIMANVHEMRIEIFDERLGEYVVPGNGTYNTAGAGPPTLTGRNGDFHIARRLNAAFGPDNRLSGAVFDTWHPDNLTTPQAGQRAPYEMYYFTPPYIANGGTTAPGVPLEPTNRGYWASSGSSLASSYAVGDVVFPYDTDVTANGQFDPGTDNPHPRWEFKIAFRCIAVNDSNGNGNIETSPNQPGWIETPGRRVTDNEVVWEAVDNAKSLRSIRMTIRFRNEKSDKMRQLTMILPLTDESN